VEVNGECYFDILLSQQMSDAIKLRFYVPPDKKQVIAGRHNNIICDNAVQCSI